MITLGYKDIAVKTFIDGTFTPNSTDNIQSYKHRFFEETEYMSIYCGILLSSPEGVINSCILGRSGHGSISEGSCLIKNDHLFFCFTDSLYSLSLPQLQIVWQTKADDVACFTVHDVVNDLITYGELQVCRININGEIIWAFSGADIFIHPHAFAIRDNRIFLTDFYGDRYILDFDGKLVTQ
jgi:hypothetical protein